jgi:tetratricopeptide (TPR) repeat protein
MRTIRRLVAWLAVVAAVLGLAVGAGAWWRHTTSPDNRLRRGQEALRRGDRAEAERLALLLRAAGQEDHAHLLQGEIIFQDARPDIDAGQAQNAAPLLRRAVGELNKVRAQGELRLRAASLSAQCLLHLGQYRQAERAFRFVLDQRPDDINAHRGLAALYYDQGAVALALSHLAKWAERDDEDGRPHLTMGAVYHGLQKFEEAIPCFEKALARRLGNKFAQDAREDLAECLIRRGACAEALKTLEACDPALSRTARVAALRVEALAGSGQAAEALSAAEAALAAFPRSPELLRLRARMHRDAGETEAEVKVLGQVLAIDPHDYASRHLVAQAYERQGRRAEAAEERRRGDEIKAVLEQIVELNNEAIKKPWDADVRRRLAKLCRQVGKTEVAEMWQKAAAACPAGPGTPE